MPKENHEFLQKKYSDLPGSQPVERAVKKARREGEPIPDKKLARIQTYLDRLDHIIKSERGWELLKQKLVKEFSIDTTNEDTMQKIAHGLYQSEKERAREQGRTEEHQQLEQESPRNILESRRELIAEKRAIQEKSLSNWLDYLQKNDAQYPTWFRYFAVRNLQKMGTMDKEKGEYTKRTKHTVAPFPELNSEALGFVYRMLTTGIGDQEFIEPEDQEKRKQLSEFIKQADFSKLYTFAQVETAGQLNKESLQGEWKRYDQKSNHHLLESSLKGKGTGWCTAEGSAYSHLQGGDFYVYYTKGRKGTFTEPRIAIRMANGQVAEVRGVNQRQELEPALIEVAQKQYHSLLGGEKFDKKSRDMNLMTVLAKKQESDQLFTKDELTFLYEMNGTIEGFGYDRDPRIQELRSQRNPKEDMLIIFECAKDQIALVPEEINQNTKAYIGLLEPGIFTKLQEYNIEHIYTSFPEGRIKRETIESGGKDKDQLIAELKSKKNNIGDYAGDMLENKAFTTQKNREQINLVRLTVQALFLDKKNHTTQEIYQKAEELGLELCQAEDGPNYRLQYQDQPLNEWLYVGMEQISDRDGNPGVFELSRRGDGLWLCSRWVRPSDQWFPESEFVFRLRKFTKET